MSEATCRECDQPVDQETRFCPYCGTDLSASFPATQKKTGWEELRDITTGFVDSLVAGVVTFVGTCIVILFWAAIILVVGFVGFAVLKWAWQEIFNR